MKRITKAILYTIITPLIAIGGILYGLSSWWHSDTTKAWLYPTFNKVYSSVHFDATRSVLDYLSEIYLDIDDKYYKSGLVEVIDQEEMNAELQATNARGSVSYDIPTWDKSFKKYSHLLPTTEEQGRTFQCTAYTVENMVESLKIRLGIKPLKKNVDRTALYEATSYKGENKGAVFTEVIRYITENGYPLPEGTDDYTGKDNFTRLKADKKRLSKVRQMSAKIFTGKIKSCWTWDCVKNEYYNGDKNRVIQVAVYPRGKSARDDYFKLKEVYARSGKMLFGHSLNGHYITKNRAGTSEGIVVSESAYYPTLIVESTDGRNITPRYIDRSMFDKGYAKVNFVELLPKFKDNTNPEVNKYNRLKEVRLYHKQSSKDVLLLEQYLRDKGYLFRLVDGFYGTATVGALRQYLYDETGVWYSGEVWGKISQSTI